MLDQAAMAALILSVLGEASGADKAPAASIPPKWEPDKYTQYFVKEAIGRYDAEGLDATVAYYNTNESVDGQWYMFILDENDIMLAHAANPALVGRPASFADGPNNYPAGEAVVAVADEDGEWFSYSFTNPVSGAAETKHSWMVAHDGLTFGSGWYERGPRKSDAPAYTQDFVGRAINLYDAIGREGTVEYYSTKESVDGQWYVFIVDADGYTIAHHNPAIIGRDPSLRVDSTGYFYGDDLLSATESGKWVDYVLLNPETGDERQKHTWAVLHDGLIFASGWYE
jgi:signal transduction histidine kinase